MFRKLFPHDNKQQHQQNNNKNKMKKKRISPSTSRSPDGFVQPNPMYQYAVNEYAQTVAPNSSNDDGQMSIFSAGINNNNNNNNEGENDNFIIQQSQPQQQINTPVESNLPQASLSRSESDLRSRSPSASFDHHHNKNNTTAFVKPQVQASAIMSPQAEHILTEVSTPLPSPHNNFNNNNNASDTAVPQPSSATGDSFHHKTHNTSRWPSASASSASAELTMPDATYEEYYGDGYVGGPIRYIYPSGYQSMRPRSGPWKLSIAVCLMMSWLSVFIIGHCSDRVDQSLYNQNEIDDDSFVIEIRWCGSRLLYCMWVISMLITGIATAYCSVIGYIKVRDFAVGNMRSQPPGMVGKSDYYVQIHDDIEGDQYHRHHYDPSDTTDQGDKSSSCAGSSGTGGGGGRYQRTIYQADGTPQFWGHHIYRPTQAAVAITSR